MAKKSNHEADIKNPNKGTNGVNPTYKKAMDNHGNNLNPNNANYKGGKKK